MSRMRRLVLAFAGNTRHIVGTLMARLTLFPYTALKIENTSECLLISSLPGEASRTHVDIARLAERFNMRSQSRAW